jgi:hypothetical protein
MYDSIQLAHTADAIDRVKGDPAEFGYDETAQMAAHMLDRFPHVRAAAAAYARGGIEAPALDSAVLDALMGF